MKRAKIFECPESVNGIQVNFCHNPNCINYGKEHHELENGSDYEIKSQAKGQPGLYCRSCNTQVTVKSNKAIAEELQRISLPPHLSRAARQTGYSCNNSKCSNFLIKPSNNPSGYRKRGVTSSGNQTWQCKECMSTFTVGSTKFREGVKNYRASHISIFRHLVEGTALRGIKRLHDTSMEEIFRKIDMFSERCELFSREREERIADLDINRMFLSSDRQQYLVNWKLKDTRKTTSFSAIGTADRKSGYVFGMDVNYDGAMDLKKIMASNSYKTSLLNKIPYREFARIWTPDELNNAEIPRVNRNRIQNLTNEMDILKLVTNGDRNLLELVQENTLPSIGALVHEEYTQYAHFLRMAHLLRNVPHLNFYTDLESGISNAINLAFSKRINEISARHMYIKINKTLTNDERLAKTNKAKKLVEERMLAMGCDEMIAQMAIISEAMLQRLQTNYNFMVGSSNIWYRNPLDTIGECDKEVSFVKDPSDLDRGRMVHLIRNATLAPIDTFFNQVRDRVSYLERGSPKPSSNRRIWSKTAPYRPDRVSKILSIFRTYRNFCEFGRDRNSTPAMRLGIAKGKVDPMDIIG